MQDTADARSREGKGTWRPAHSYISSSCSHSNPLNQISCKMHQKKEYATILKPSLPKGSHCRILFAKRKGWLRSSPIKGLMLAFIASSDFASSWATIGVWCWWRYDMMWYCNWGCPVLESLNGWAGICSLYNRNGINRSVLVVHCKEVQLSPSAKIEPLEVL